MRLKIINTAFTVCKIADITQADLTSPYCFISKTDAEVSLVCDTAHVPEHTLARRDGWRAFRVEGELDFALVGILSQISTILAQQKISIFAVSTYNTDYILTQSAQFQRALDILSANGYQICK